MWSRQIDVPDLGTFVSSVAQHETIIWLDSAHEIGELGRYSYVCVNPIKTLNATKHVRDLRAVLQTYQIDRIKDGPPFQGGLIGFFDYGYAARWMRELANIPGISHYDHYILVCDTLIALDHKLNQAWILSAGLSPEDHRPNQQRAVAQIDALAGQIEAARPKAAKPVNLAWRAEITRRAYIDCVEKTQDYIRAGDIYQANFAHRFHADLPPGVDAFDVYKMIRASNPAPFSAFMRTPKRSIACTSPERLLRLSGDGKIEARPIKGTIKRLEDPRADAKQRLALSNSVKDRAENTMIVDLLRNDLSTIASPHTVEVPALCLLESYAGLHQLTSAVTGQLAPEFDGFDAFKAVFPGGSITGAPKSRAIEIIAELEQCPRGAFCGAIGYFGFDGAVDLNIMIRTVQLTDRAARLDVGGGITILSDPAAEYEETLLKAARIMSATMPATATI